MGTPGEPVTLLRGLEEIAGHLRTNRERVRAWLTEPGGGFPAFQHTDRGTYYAVAADLDAWILSRRAAVLGGLTVYVDPNTGQVAARVEGRGER